MSTIKKEPQFEKNPLHPRNRHQGRYDFKLLIDKHPALATFVRKNPFGDLSINFADPEAVRSLNAALLASFYGINTWNIPPNYLCPPIPGRADYLHYVADLLAQHSGAVIPKGTKINCLDVGVGASCIYPLIGTKEYGWKFTGTEIDTTALLSAESILKSNQLSNLITLRQQEHIHDVLKGVILPKEYFDLTLCNPPFHHSASEAAAGSLRKVNNLTKTKVIKPILNFGGKSNELWCKGGEIQFVRRLIVQSGLFAKQCFWFTTLISKESNLKAIYGALNQAKVTAFKTIAMAQGNKTSRIVAWTYLSVEEQKTWVNQRWQ